MGVSKVSCPRGPHEAVRGLHEAHTRVSRGRTRAHEARTRLHEASTRPVRGEFAPHEAARGPYEVNSRRTRPHEGFTRPHEGFTRLHEARTSISWPCTRKTRGARAQALCTSVHEAARGLARAWAQPARGARGINSRGTRIAHEHERIPSLHEGVHEKSSCGTSLHHSCTRAGS